MRLVTSSNFTGMTRSLSKSAASVPTTKFQSEAPAALVATVPLLPLPVLRQAFRSSDFTNSNSLQPDFRRKRRQV